MPAALRGSRAQEKVDRLSRGHILPAAGQTRWRYPGRRAGQGIAAPGWTAAAPGVRPTWERGPANPGFPACPGGAATLQQTTAPAQTGRAPALRAWERRPAADG